ncbi:MAG: cytochrome P450 [Candidatus Nanopelagicales bacterium]
MSAPAACPFPGAAIDLFDEAFVANPWGPLAELREQAPVMQDPLTGYWLISRHNDIRQVLMQPDVFRPDNALTAVTEICPAALRILASVGFHLPATLANNGYDHHPQIRSLVAKFFTPARISRFTPAIAELARTAARKAGDQLAAQGQVDLVDCVTKDFPALVLMEVLGLSDIDIAVLKVRSAASLELFWGNPDAERQLELARYAAQFYSWLGTRIRQADPAGDDLFGVLAAGRHADGRPLDPAEAVGIGYFLLVAGQETTSQLLATLLRRLIGSPEWWEQVGQADEPLARAAAVKFIEEVLRLEPPVVTWRRVVAQETTLDGHCLPAGAEVLLMLAGSGTDAQVFDHPDDFAPGRPNVRRHLAFGIGRHFCLGATLARVEAQEFVRALARELPPLQLLEPAPPMLGLLSFRAPRRLLVAADTDISAV